MKIALLSGAIKNAGDYLITHRTKELLNYCYTDATIFTITRNILLNENSLKMINDCDLAIIGGGPCYKWDLYPQSIPLTPDLSQIKTPLAILGGGWYGDITDPDEIWNYSFSDTTKTFLKRVVTDSHLLGCRDYYAQRVLKANGFEQGIMTGCPAWYDVSKLSKRLCGLREIKKIAISDPADIFHYGKQSLELCRYLKKHFENAEIIYLFHRGTVADSYTDSNTARQIAKLKSELLKMEIQCHDISYGFEGFHIYDDCDLHIGHRVHAHIYNLSQRHLSILIEEDARGAGVDEALGLWSIKAYSRKKKRKSNLIVKCYNKIYDYTKSNDYFLNDVQAYLDYLLQTEGRTLNVAFSVMEQYFEDMEKHINSLLNIM